MNNKVGIVITILMVIITILFMNGEKLGLTLIVDEDREGQVSEKYFTNNDLKSNLSDIKMINIDLDHVVNSTGYYQYDNDIVITNSGYYHISGNLNGGGIIVDTNDNSKVWLVLDGVSITNDDACIRIDNADKVFINTINENYLHSDLSDNTIDGTIYSKDDLSINGNGSLNISSNIHGIVCNDALTIVDTKITIDVSKDGLHVNDSIEISNANINIAADDGMTCDSEDSYIYIASGNMIINCDDDAIKAESEVIIDGGSINISNCYEGIEALNITINDGDIFICANDDGINATNGNNGFRNTDAENMPNVIINGGNTRIINTNGVDVDGIDSNGNIIINGGKVFVNINGSQANNAFDYGTEANGVFMINGGYVIGMGSSSMLESVSDDSLQNCIEYYGSNTGDVTNIKLLYNDEVLIDEQTVTGFNCLLISSPELTINNSYDLYIDDNITSIELSDKITVVGSSNTNMFNRGNMKNNGQFNNDGFEQKTMKPEMPSRENMPDTNDRPIMDNKTNMDNREGMMSDFDRGNRQQPMEESVAVISEPISMETIVTIIISIITLVIGIIIVKKYHRYG